MKYYTTKFTFALNSFYETENQPSKLGESRIRYSIYDLFKNPYKTHQNGLSLHVDMSSQVFMFLTALLYS